MTEVKAVRASFKAADGADGEKGYFEAFASVFGNVDHYGDRMIEGAFKNTLAEWAEKGDPIPVIHSHRWNDPDAYVGEVVEAAEKTIGGKSGLWYRGKADLDHAPAARVFTLMKRRLITQQSFAYDVVKAQYVEEENDGPWPEVRELHEVGLHEVGPTLLGANSDTDLLEAASHDGKRPRGLIVVDLGSKTGRDALRKVLATHDDEDAPSGSKTDAGDTTTTIDVERVNNLLTQTRYKE